MAFQGNAFQTNAFQAFVPGVGGAGAATFATLVEDGGSVTYSWQTDVIKMLSGLEQRAAARAKPRQRYEFTSILSDEQHRRLLSTLAGEAAAAPLFLLALAYEGIPVVSSTAGSIVVDDLAFCDWAVPGQRIAVERDGVLGEAVVQSAVGETIAVDVDLTAVAKLGAVVMPAVGVFLEADQGFGRWPVGAGQWRLVARMQRNGFAPGSVVGTGVVVNTYDGLPLWDWGIAVEVADQPLYAGSELVDLGGQISTLASSSESDWGRAIRIHSGHREDWQWFQRFLHTVQGRRRKFLLATGRPDLVPVSDASSGTLTVEGPPVANAPDYVNDWFPSLAHRRLKLVKTDETFAYRKVVSCSASTGTQDLVLDSPLAGALERVEFLEQVRLSSDEVTVTWNGFEFESAIAARVVQQ